MKSFEQIKDEYNLNIKNNIRRKMGIMISINVPLLLLALTFFYLKDDNVFDILFIIASILFLAGLLVQFILRLAKPTKPLFNYLYREIMNEIHYDASNYYTIDYEPFIKEDGVIERGGLFPKGASKSVRYKFTFNTEMNKMIQVYDIDVFTQTDKTRVTYFNGLYVVIPSDNNKYFQLRANSKPKKKGVKFERIEVNEEIKEYVEKFSENSIESRYYQLYRMLQDDYPKKKVYIGGTDHEIHLGVFVTPLDKKLKVLTYETYRNLYNQTLELITRIEQYSNTLDL